MCACDVGYTCPRCQRDAERRDDLAWAEDEPFDREPDYRDENMRPIGEQP